MSKDSLLLLSFPLMLTMVLILSGRQLFELKNLEDSYGLLNLKNNELNLKIAELMTVKKNLNKEQEKEDAIQELLKGRLLWSSVFKELTLLVPKEIWLVSLNNELVNETQKKIEITGESLSAEAVTHFFKSLEESYYFSQVRLVFVEKQLDKSPSLYRFRFNCLIHNNSEGTYAEH